MNIALYGPRATRWAMTERGRSAVRRSVERFEIGPSAVDWRGHELILDIREVSAPLPRPVRGRIRVIPEAINATGFTLESAGSHVWRPIAPRSRVEVQFENPALGWSGDGYFDMNSGAESLEAAFAHWTWSRASTREGAAVIYDATRRRTHPLSLALQFNASGEVSNFEAPPVVRLPTTRWRLPRQTRSDGEAGITRSLEDTPFYSRSLASVQWLDQKLVAVHEMLSLDRFARPIVKCMLPFRMPRWTRPIAS